MTSIGKRVSLLELFQDEIKKISLDFKIYTTDMNPDFAPAGIISNKCFKVPRATDLNYITFLVDICKIHNIHIIIPTIDTELMMLSENKELFYENDIVPLVSDKYFITLCRDKRLTGKYFAERGISVPEFRDKLAPIFPLFAKPYDGSLSKDIYIIKNEEELTSTIINHPKLIFMEYIDKKEYKEFTVDMYYGRDNKVKSIVPRERIEIRAGEINKGYTKKNYLVGFLKERMGYLPGVIGCICVQLFFREIDNDVKAIEINPRFGGGYPLSYHAHANFPSYIIREYILGETLDYSDDWLDNTLMLRYDKELIVYDKK
jgi:carbamoyl-phosphate synthase large subunit